MTDPASISISPRAVADIQTHRMYILQRFCDPVAADRIANAIFSAIEGLGQFPSSGHPVNSRWRALRLYRHVQVERYAVFYRYDVNANEVFVVRVLHTLQNQISILLKDARAGQNESISF